MATIYLAGPMTGLPEFNYPAFNRCALAWEVVGHKVINPASSFDGDTTHPREDYMRLNFQNILGVDYVAVLPGWERSKGATIEVMMAWEIGVPVIPATVAGGATFLATIKPIGPATPSCGCAEREEIGVATIATDRGSALAKRAYDFAGEVDGGGYKSSMDSPEKLRMSLIPSALYRAAARSLGHGAAKYADHNWRRGMRWSEVQSALLRHVAAWSEGEDNDPDSGLNHIDHIAACVAFLAEYVERPEYAKFDDRFKGIGRGANG